MDSRQHEAHEAKRRSVHAPLRPIPNIMSHTSLLLMIPCMVFSEGHGEGTGASTLLMHLCVARTRLRRAGIRGAPPHAGDQLEPAPLGGPEPPVSLAPHPPVPGLSAWAFPRVVGLVTALVGAERLPPDEVAELLGVGCAAVEVQVRIVLGTSDMMTTRMMMIWTCDDDKDDDDDKADDKDDDDDKKFVIIIIFIIRFVIIIIFIKADDKDDDDDTADATLHSPRHVRPVPGGSDTCTGSRKCRSPGCRARAGACAARSPPASPQEA